MSNLSDSSMSMVSNCGQTMDEKLNSFVNYQMTVPSAPNKHINLYQSPLKGTVIMEQPVENFERTDSNS